MKTVFIGLGLFSLTAATLPAQSYTVLHRFLPGGTDGVMPSTLTLSQGALYGVTAAGGTNNAGTIYKLDVNINQIDPSGTNYWIIKHFGNSTNPAPFGD